MALGQLVKRTASPDQLEQRSSLSLQQYASFWQRFSFNGIHYITPNPGLTELSALEAGYNSVAASCIAVRGMVFSEARFVWQRWQSPRPGEMFGDTSLGILERPWESASTGDLLAWMELDASLYGNSYWVLDEGELVRLDPNNVVVMCDDRGNGWGKRLIGYAVKKDGFGEELAFFLPSEVAHYRPLPDPHMPFKGRSWLSACLPDVVADNELTIYKHAFVKNAATPNMAIVFDPTLDADEIEKYAEVVDAHHRGSDKAFKTLYLGGGADVKMLGSNFEQLSLKAVQGAGETRIAMAAGVPPSILGASEAMQGSALTTGNYQAARRRFADGTMRPLWRAACAALEVLVPPPPGVRLWFSDRDVSFLQEDVMDAAQIKQQEAATMKTLVDAGYTPDSVREAVMTGEWNRLQHSGLVSVQLMPPGSTGGTAGSA